MDRVVSAGPPVRAAIIAVGSEMLSGTRIDSNSLFVTEVLNGIGIDVACKAVVGDDRDELTAQIGFALARHRVLVLTGGLGPTDDDLTRETVAAHLHRPLDEDAAILASIRERFAQRGWHMPEVNRRQAQVPRGATVLDNPRGSAPGLLIEHGDRIVVLLPGPPHEMQPMMIGPVRDRLAPLTGGRPLQRRVLKVAGRTESRVEEMVQPIYSQWLQQVPRIETTILAAPGQIELQLSARSEDATLARGALDVAVAQLEAALGGDLVSVDGRTMAQVVGTLLLDRQWHIAVAESCTGGLLASQLTDVPGSSAYVDRGIVAYSNAAKIEWLNVPAALIAAHGAVSDPVARAMAAGVRTGSGVEVGVGITGIAGPGGGTPDKPVGTVCIAAALPSGVTSEVFRFLGGRESVKAFAVNAALDMVRRLLLGVPTDVDWITRR